MGIGRFEQEASFSGRKAYKGTSSFENGGRKSPIKIEIRKDFYLTTVSFAVLSAVEALFYYFQDFFGLAKCDSPFVFIFFRVRAIPVRFLFL